MSPPSPTDHAATRDIASWGRGRLWSILVFASVAGVCGAALFAIPAFHDEVHFCHATWLYGQGERPFDDFLFHNPPAILALLDLGGIFDPDYGPEVVYWGRFLCWLSLVSSASLIYRMTRAGAPRCSATFAACFWMFLMIIPAGNAPELRKQPWSIRPEVYAMPFALYGCRNLFFASKTRDRATRTVAEESRLSTLCTGVALGVALCISMRLVFPIGATLAACWLWRTQPRAFTLAVAGIAAAIVLVCYGWIYGWENSWYWIVRYSSDLRSAHLPADARSDVFAGFRMLPAKFLIALSLPAAVTLIAPRFCGIERAEPVLARTLAALGSAHLLQFAAPFSEFTPGFTAWQSIIAFTAIVNTIAIARIRASFSRRTPFLVCAALGLFACVYPLRPGVTRLVALANHEELRLFAQIDAYRTTCDALRGLRYVGHPNYHPIGVRDGGYAWTQVLPYEKFVAKLPPDFPRHDPAAELRADPPAILFVPNAVVDPLALRTLLESQYSKLDENWYVLKSDEPRLATELRSPGIARHVKIPLSSSGKMQKPETSADGLFNVDP